MSNLRLEEPPDSDAPDVFVIVPAIIESIRSQIRAAIRSWRAKLRCRLRNPIWFTVRDERKR